jgi:DNA-binding GntR family transcriptional regulator
MPVPVPSPENQEPRRLLRDVVFEKMLAAIGDGTLELGERLNDDELVRWLGVSRTPVREAIAKLADFGLVDIEANRYTRVISPSLAEVADTIRAGIDLWRIVAGRAAEVMTDAQVSEFSALVDDVLAAFDRKEADFGLRFGSVFDYLTQATASPSLQRMSETISSRAALLTRKAEGAYQWDAGRTIVEQVRAAVVAHDPAAAEAALPTTGWIEGWTERVRALGIFPN